MLQPLFYCTATEMASFAATGAFGSIVLLLCFLAFTRLKRYISKGRDLKCGNAYHDIAPIPHFDWRRVEPLKLRPFQGKPKYHLTMAIQACTVPDMITMDNTYVDRLHIRRGIIRNNKPDVIGYNPVARDAVFELYVWIFETYLPKRYPSMFSVLDEGHPSNKSARRVVRNITTGEDIPLDPLPDPEECMCLLGSHVDSEFNILVPTSDPHEKPFRAEPTQAPQEPYHLHAFVLAFPAGFNTGRKLGFPLAAIHGPVPGYAAKIEKSMDRFFASLPFGKMVKRANWAIETDEGLLKLGGGSADADNDGSGGDGEKKTQPGEAANHFDLTGGGTRGSLAVQNGGSPEVTDNSKAGKRRIRVDMAPATYSPSDEDVAGWAQAAETIDASTCFLRMERQTLHRLEKTGAIVFAFKTYMEPLSSVKAGGDGEKLAQAVEGMGKGSVPAMDVYKSSVVWRSKVVEYLTRSD